MGKAGFRLLNIVHILGVLLLSVGLKAFGFEHIASFVFGGLVTTVNFYTLAIVLNAFTSEKSVALALLLVVFKYAILGYFIYYLVGQNNLHLLGFALGVGSLIITGPVAALLITKQARGKNESL
ncbi:MAG: hypothetical protein KDD37_04075 [Bdellovibrionales bacterium]|nr:hypothetical protein [Bdellovibrionales bacterium]